MTFIAHRNHTNVAAKNVKCQVMYTMSKKREYINLPRNMRVIVENKVALFLSRHNVDDSVSVTGWRTCKRKGNVNLYIESSQMPLMHTDMDHTVLPANNTISAFTR